jgi:hypothetical protein
MLLTDSFRSINEGTRHKGLGKPPPIFGAPPKPVGAETPVIKAPSGNYPHFDSRTHGCEKRNHSHHVHQKIESSTYEESRHGYKLPTRMPDGSGNFSAKMPSKWLEFMPLSNQSSQTPFDQDWWRKQATTRSNSCLAHHQLQPSSVRGKEHEN